MARPAKGAGRSPVRPLYTAGGPPVPRSRAPADRRTPGAWVGQAVSSPLESDEDAASAIVVKPATSPASSIGTTTFDAGEEPIVLRASRYCRRIVFSSAMANQYLAIAMPALAAYANPFFWSYTVMGALYLAGHSSGLHLEVLQRGLGGFIGQGYQTLALLLFFGLLWMLFEPRLRRRAG